MSQHPINLAFRFFLELTGLASVAVWGFRSADGIAGVLLAFAAPVIFATLWGVFAVKGDPSRSGKTVIETPRIFRLLLEIALFTLAVLALQNAGYQQLSLLFAIALLIHYAISWDRVAWLLGSKKE